MPIELTPETRWYGRRKSTWHRATLGPITETEQTKTGAQERLIRSVETAISGDFTPAMFNYGDGRVLVYRDMTGWYFRFWEGVTSMPTEGYAVSCGSSPREDAMRSAKVYLAQSQYPARNGLDLLAGDRDAIERQCGWLAFHRAYETARREGKDDTQAHAYAAQNAYATGSWLTDEEQAILDFITG